MSNKQRLRLVSEARPLDETQLVEFEIELIKEVLLWIEHILDQNALTSSETTALEKNRSGRVLFIDGERGSGKTSLLLTLLASMDKNARWRNAKLAPFNKLCGRIKRLDPILDFDPLPDRMSIHSWLLQPWLEYIQREHNDEELLHEFENLEECAVSGWPNTHSHHGGPVERAIEQSEQSRAWLRIQRTWRSFVDKVIERGRGIHCEKPIFVIAIDDADLQVERLPSLLHAMRLLHHPNLVYIVTGNYKHLEQVVYLHYLGRHLNLLAAGHHRAAGATALRDLAATTRIVEPSDRLARALLNKALPPHSRIQMQDLSWMDIQSLVRSDAATFSDDVWKAILDGLPLNRQIAGARAVQHAIDKWLSPTNQDPDHFDKKSAAFFNECNFVATLAGFSTTSLVGHPSSPHESTSITSNSVISFADFGELTTSGGAPLRSWSGNNLTITLSDTPAFSLTTSPDDDERARESSAVAAAILRLASERSSAHLPKLELPRLTWVPDAWMLATKVTWRPMFANARGLGLTQASALLGWPFLVRPNLGELLSANINEWAKLENEPLCRELKSENGLVSMWLAHSIQLFFKHHPALCNDETALAEWTSKNQPGSPTRCIEYFIEKLLKIPSDRRNDTKEDDKLALREVLRWIMDLYLLTAPYFGLNQEDHERDDLIEVGVLRNQLKKHWSKLSKSIGGNEKSAPDFLKRLSDEQDSVLDNAIALSTLTSNDSEISPSGLRIDFIKVRQRMDVHDTHAKAWWDSIVEAPSTARAYAASRSGAGAPRR